MLVTKMAKTNNLELLPTHFVSNICHQLGSARFEFLKQFLDVRKLKNELIVNRRENLNKKRHKTETANTKKTKKQTEIKKFPINDLLENPQNGKKSWADISKAFDNKQTISFSLCNGLRLAVPTNSSAKIV